MPNILDITDYEPGAGTGGTASEMQGTAPDGATPVGDPLDIALQYLTTPPTLTNNQHYRLQGDAGGNLKITLATALSQAIDSILTYPRGSNPTLPLTASTLIQTGPGKLTGIFVAAASATPTIKLWNNTAASGEAVVETFTPVAGTYYPFPHVRYPIGLYITISGTVSANVYYDPTNT